MRRALLLAFLLAPAFLGAEDPASKWVEEFRSEDSGKKAEAKKRLRSYRFREVAAAMAEYANDPNPDMRILMAQTLGELGGFEAARELKRIFLKEEDPKVRRAILIQLSGLLPEEKEALKFFKRVARKDPEKDLRLLSLTQLSLLGRSPLMDYQLKRVYWKVLKKDKDAGNRAFAAVLLSELGETRSRLKPVILEAVRSPSVELRRKAALALGKSKVPDLRHALEALARDPDTEVRENLAQSLFDSASPDRGPILKTLAQDPEAPVRKKALEALKAQGRP